MEDSTSSQKEGDKDNNKGEKVKTAAAAATPTASGSGSAGPADSNNDDMDPMEAKLYSRFFDKMFRGGKGPDSSDDKERRRHKMKRMKMMMMMEGGDMDPDDDMDPGMFSRFFDKMMRKGKGSSSSHDRERRRQEKMMMMTMDDDMDDPWMFRYYGMMDPYHYKRYGSQKHKPPESARDIKGKEQRNWMPPEAVIPTLDSKDDATEEMQVEHGIIQTDAALYTVTVVSCQHASLYFCCIKWGTPVIVLW